MLTVLDLWNELFTILIQINLTGVPVDFARFLEVEEVKGVILFPTQFWERYDKLMFSFLIRCLMILV